MKIPLDFWIRLLVLVIVSANKTMFDGKKAEKSRKIGKTGVIWDLCKNHNVCNMSITNLLRGKTFTPLISSRQNASFDMLLDYIQISLKNDLVDL